LPPIALDRIGRDARFRLLHEAFLLTLAPLPNALVACGRSHIRFELYQQIPALRLLSLPKPRILNASDVGLGKTIETAIALRELIARRRGGRILIVCPSGITEQWQEEMSSELGLEFKVFDREGVHVAKKSIDLGANPWAIEPRIIASFDYLKRHEGAFREVQNVRFSVIVCDEVHHLADNTAGEDISDRHRLARWIARANDALILLSATPHSGYDESFASLLNLIEPTLVTDAGEMSFKSYDRYLVRHLKRHIRKDDGSPLFVAADPSKPIPVTLTSEKEAVHSAVAEQAATLDAQAERLKAEPDRFALRLVATILRKRAASSLAALRETVANRLRISSRRPRRSNCGAIISVPFAREKPSRTRISDSSNATPTGATSLEFDLWARCFEPSRARWKTCWRFRTYSRSARLIPSRKQRRCSPSCRRSTGRNPTRR
jgi:hypothetical protein